MAWIVSLSRIHSTARLTRQYPHINRTHLHTDAYTGMHATHARDMHTMSVHASYLSCTQGEPRKRKDLQLALHALACRLAAQSAIRSGTRYAKWAGGSRSQTHRRAAILLYNSVPDTDTGTGPIPPVTVSRVNAYSGGALARALPEGLCYLSTYLSLAELRQTESRLAPQDLIWPQSSQPADRL